MFITLGCTACLQGFLYLIRRLKNRFPDSKHQADIQQGPVQKLPCAATSRVTSGAIQTLGKAASIRQIPWGRATIRAGFEHFPEETHPTAEAVSGAGYRETLVGGVALGKTKAKQKYHSWARNSPLSRGTTQTKDRDTRIHFSLQPPLFSSSKTPKTLTSSCSLPGWVRHIPTVFTPFRTWHIHSEFS